MYSLIQYCVECRKGFHMARTKKNHPVYMTGDEMRRIRIKLGKTQLELGQLIGKTHKHISRLEQDFYPITKTVARLLQEMEASYDIRQRMDRNSD